MTGGQISPTSPRGSFGSTAPYGAIEAPFDLARLVTAAGATYVARWTTAHPFPLSEVIKKGLQNKGFSFIEVISQCPTYFGRKNKMRSAVEMMRYLKEQSVVKARADKMSEDELEGKIIVGDFVDRSRPEFTELLHKLIEEKRREKPPEIVKSAYKSEL